MNFLTENWMLIAVAVASGGMLMWPAINGGARGGGVNPTDAVMLINREKAVVIDVCSPDEYAAGHIAGAKNVPYEAVLQVMDQLQRAQIKRVGLLVAPTGK